MILRDGELGRLSAMSDKELVRHYLIAGAEEESWELFSSAFDPSGRNVTSGGPTNEGILAARTKSLRTRLGNIRRELAKDGLTFDKLNGEDSRGRKAGKNASDADVRKEISKLAGVRSFTASEKKSRDELVLRISKARKVSHDLRAGLANVKSVKR